MSRLACPQTMRSPPITAAPTLRGECWSSVLWSLFCLARSSSTCCRASRPDAWPTNVGHLDASVAGQVLYRVASEKSTRRIEGLMAKVWFVYEGPDPTVGSAAYELPASEAIDRLLVSMDSILPQRPKFDPISQLGPITGGTGTIERRTPDGRTLNTMRY